MREPRNGGSEEGIRSAPRLHPPPRLKRRADFLRAAKGQRAHAAAFSLQASRRRDEAEQEPPRFGFTVTKKLGGAVLRNRIRRRLKEALRLSPALPACPGYDYVIVGRPAALNQDFAALKEALRQAFAHVHGRDKPAKEHSRNIAPSAAPRAAKSLQDPPKLPAKTKD